MKEKVCAIIVALAAIVLFGIGGCCGNPLGNPPPTGAVLPVGTTAKPSISNCWYDVKAWFCKNIATIVSQINAAITTENTINTEYPGVIPPEAQAVFNQAAAVIQTGEAELAAAWCPSGTAVANVQAATAKLEKVRATLNADRQAKDLKLIR